MSFFIVIISIILAAFGFALGVACCVTSINKITIKAAKIILMQDMEIYNLKKQLNNKKE